MSRTVAGYTPGQDFAPVGNETPQLIWAFIINMRNLVYAETAYAFALSASFLAHLLASNLKWDIVVGACISAVLFKAGVGRASALLALPVQEADAVCDYFGNIPALAILFISPHLHSSIHSHKAALAQIVSTVFRLFAPNNDRDKICLPFALFIEKGAVNREGKGCHRGSGRNIL
jgi:hypothetical protein